MPVCELVKTHYLAASCPLPSTQTTTIYVLICHFDRPIGSCPHRLQGGLKALGLSSYRQESYFGLMAAP